MAGAYKYRPQYTQNTVGVDAPSEAGRMTDKQKQALWDNCGRMDTLVPLIDAMLAEAEEVTLAKAANDTYVAWLRFAAGPGDSKRIVTCDSDDEGAFKVYRHSIISPDPHYVERKVLEARWNELCSSIGAHIYDNKRRERISVLATQLAALAEPKGGKS